MMPCEYMMDSMSQRMLPTVNNEMVDYIYIYHSIYSQSAQSAHLLVLALHGAEDLVDAPHSEEHGNAGGVDAGQRSDGRASIVLQPWKVVEVVKTSQYVCQQARGLERDGPRHLRSRVCESRDELAAETHQRQLARVRLKHVDYQLQRCCGCEAAARRLLLDESGDGCAAVMRDDHIRGSVLLKRLQKQGNGRRARRHLVKTQTITSG